MEQHQLSRGTRRQSDAVSLDTVYLTSRGQKMVEFLEMELAYPKF